MIEHEILVQFEIVLYSLALMQCVQSILLFFCVWIKRISKVELDRGYKIEINFCSDIVMSSKYPIKVHFKVFLAVVFALTIKVY